MIYHNIVRRSPASVWRLGILSPCEPPATPIASAVRFSCTVAQVDDKNFKETVLKSDGVWLVEFYAPWCGEECTTPSYHTTVQSITINII